MLTKQELKQKSDHVLIYTGALQHQREENGPLDQVTIVHYTQKIVWPVSDVNLGKMHKKGTNIAVLDNQPLSIVNDQEFIKLVVHLGRNIFCEILPTMTYNTLRFQICYWKV